VCSRQSLTGPTVFGIAAIFATNSRTEHRPVRILDFCDQGGTFPARSDRHEFDSVLPPCPMKVRESVIPAATNSVSEIDALHQILVR